MIICKVRTCLYNDHGECEADDPEFAMKESEGPITVDSRKECPFGRCNRGLE